MYKLQHCLGARGKGGKVRADRVNCPKNFVLHCKYKLERVTGCTSSMSWNLQELFTYCYNKENSILDLQNLLYERCVIMLVDLASMYQTKYGTVLWWPTTVTAKPKTSRQKQNTSRQNQKLHGKNKIPHGKTKNLTAKTKYLTAKPNTSQQKQNSFGFAVGIWFCREVFGFFSEVFGFAVRSLVLPWGFWFCRDSCTVQFIYSGGKMWEFLNTFNIFRSSVSLFCYPLRHFIRYVCSKSRRSNNHFSQPLLSAFSCDLRYLSAQLKISSLVYRLPRVQSK